MKDRHVGKPKLNNVVLVVLLAISICLGGCGVPAGIDKGLKANKKKADDKYWTERNVPPVDLAMDVSCAGEEINFDVDMRVSRCVYKYLEDVDKELLKGMFAKSVISEHPEIDNEIDALIGYYNGLEVDGYEVKTNSYYKSHSLKRSETIVEYAYHTEFVSDGERYELDILFVRESDSDEDLLGVHGIKLRNRDTNESYMVNTVNCDI